MSCAFRNPAFAATGAETRLVSVSRLAISLQSLGLHGMAGKDNWLSVTQMTKPDS